jgi:antitoxin (DNA-binding transcriptional repressor) of toxin-antitoxin stability system
MMQVRTMTSDEARQNWGELIDAILGGEVAKIMRYNRPVAVVISPKMWDKILADYERLDDAEDLIAVYRREINKLRGVDPGEIMTADELEAWIAEDEPVPA